MANRQPATHSKNHLGKEEDMSRYEPAPSHRDKWDISLRKLFAFAALCVVVAVGSMSYILYIGEQMSVRYGSQCCASMEMRLETALAQLWLEEFLGGEEQHGVTASNMALQRLSGTWTMPTGTPGQCLQEAKTTIGDTMLWRMLNCAAMSRLFKGS